MKYSIVVLFLLGAVALFAQPRISLEAKNGFLTGTEIYFEALNIDPVNDTVSWDFGDGTLTGEYSGRTFVHYYKFPGFFVVKLIIDDVVADSSTIAITDNRGKLLPRTEAGLVVYLPFENDLNDAGGNGFDAVWVGLSNTFQNGISGKCLDVSGGRNIRIPLFDTINGSSGLTVSFWAKRNNIDGSDRIYMVDKDQSFRILFRSNGDCYQAFVYNDSTNNHAEVWYEDIKNLSWHHYMFVYGNGLIRLFIDGVEVLEGEKCPVELSGNINSISGDLYIGSSSSSTYNFEGYIDELKIYNRALTNQELTTKFEIIHANFQSRIAQKIMTIIPPDLISDATNRMIVSISGKKGYSEVLADRTNLSEKEYFTLQNSKLPADTYKISIQIQNSEDEIIGEISEAFIKEYDGAPQVGIDENNAIRVNGDLFFPVTPFGLGNADVQAWSDSGYVNCLYGQGFWPQDYSPAGWTEYVGLGEDAGLEIIGPGGLFMNGLPARGIGSAELEAHINACKESGAMLAYTWDDEPELGGRTASNPPQSISAWTYKTHELDPQRPVLVNLVGPYIDYVDGAYNREVSDGFFPMYNENAFGKKTFVVEIYSMDYYPVDWAAPHSRGAKMSVLASILDKMKERTYGMVPLSSFVETCNIRENDVSTVFDPTNWDPTPEMLKMMIWINVVHGVKSLSWFPYHSKTPEKNFPVMKEFIRQITTLTPVVLGPELTTNIELTTDAEARIDYMIREYNGKTYVFAVRVSELEDGPNNTYADGDRNPDGYPDPVQNYAVKAQFTIPGLSAATIHVYDENRSLTLSNGQFEDQFEPYDVHIYEIDKTMTGTNLSVHNTSAGFVLRQNFPNPLNSETTIQYTLPVKCQVNLSVYNMFGQEVATLVKNTQDAGNYEVGFNALRLSSGMYLYQLRAIIPGKTDDVLLVKKLMVVK